MLKLIWGAIVALSLTNAYADDTRLIVKTKKGISIRSFNFEQKGHKVKPLVQSLNVNLLKVDKTRVATNMQNVISELRNNPDIEYVQIDHPVTLRKSKQPKKVQKSTGIATPNDEGFSSQWSLGQANKASNSFGIDAELAWGAFGTGGKDLGGNEIVIAIVDGGVDIKHKDIIPNLWINKGEIPNNNIDDDNNGFIDDVNGWNAYTKTGEVESNYHGTHVAGIAGAKGDNKLQVAGVNWNVKIMVVNGSSGETSTVLEAYNYVLKQKQLWLSSGGKKGANVVATNSSFGVDFADCNSEEYPAWNDIYNEMGKNGILSAAATANNDVNIDEVGDVPTGCSSPYLISVTNTGKDGKRAYAGYGKKTIQIAAPGEEILSTLPNNQTGELSGTSMATPHVAGAIAYLHSVASTGFHSLSTQDPGKASLELKNILLNTVTSTDDLKKETVSGGILNLNNAAKSINRFASTTSIASKK